MVCFHSVMMTYSVGDGSGLQAGQLPPGHCVKTHFLLIANRGFFIIRKFTYSTCRPTIQLVHFIYFDKFRFLHKKSYEGDEE